MFIVLVRRTPHERASGRRRLDDASPSASPSFSCVPTNRSADDCTATSAIAHELALIATSHDFVLGLYGSMHARETLYKRGKELRHGLRPPRGARAMLDELTGAANRSSIMSAVDEENARTGRSALPCSVA